MRGDANRFSLEGVQLEPMQDETKELGDIVQAQNTFAPIATCIPLKQVPFSRKLLELDTLTAGVNHRNLAMRGDELCVNFFEQPHGLPTHREKLALLVCVPSLWEQSLDIQRYFLACGLPALR